MMKNSCPRLTKKTVVTFILLLIAPIAFASLASKTVELRKVKHTITTVQKNIKTTSSRQSHLQSELRNCETETGKLTITLSTTEKHLAVAKNKYIKLVANESYFHNRLKAQKMALADLMHSTYMIHNQSYLALLKQSFDTINRDLIYYRYLQNQRLQLASDLQKTLIIIKKNETATAKQLSILRSLEKKQQAQMSQLQKLAHSRTTLLKSINAQLHSQHSKLAKLMADKNSLQKVINNLRAISEVFATPLPKLKMKLSWPTKGKVEYLYGHPISKSQLRYKGDLIRAPKGQVVHAVAAGRVVFAQWLQGYGLLLILNHGNGYMTLYGHNMSLYKKVGDVVTRGEKIATVGATGGYKTPALFFAIWHNGTPEDPKLWCKA